MIKVLLSLLIVCPFSALQATIFTVTNTNATGAGSLKQAVDDARFTGTLDTVAFDIPGAAPHTITSGSVFFYSPTYIDGDSQPANGYTGNGKKIIYRSSGADPNGFGFFTDSCTVKNIQFEDWDNTVVGFSGASYLTFEGNAFIKRVPSGGFSVLAYGCIGCTIKDNLFSKEEMGGPCVGYSPSYHILFTASKKMEFTGNEMCVFNNTQAFRLTDVDSTIIQGNVLGGNPDDCSILNQTAISFNDTSTNNIIGGILPGEENTFIGFNDSGISLTDGSKENLVSFNVFHCILDDGIEVTAGSQNNKTAPEITFADGASVIGTAAPGDKVAIYRSTDNASLSCGGVTVPQSDLYYGEVTADGAGNWTMTGTFEGFLTATATDAANNTSVFADVYDTGVGFTNTSSPCYSLILAAEEFSLQAQYHSATGTLLSWNSLGESTSAIQVQRSTDLQRWIQLGRLPAVGNSDFRDPHPPAGYAYYRIQQMSEDGSTMLSSIVSVFVDAREWTELHVFPNPTTDQLTLIPHNHSFLMPETTVELFTLQGKSILINKIEETSSSHEMKIDHLPRGVYILSISSQNQRLQQKISIL
ncbi:MAG: T9SS type A sorting domain-containing protein [Bacteroidota bacterium]